MIWVRSNSMMLFVQILLGQVLFCRLICKEERGVWGKNPARSLFFKDFTTSALTWVFVAWAMREWDLCTKLLLLRAWKVFFELFSSSCILVSSGRSSLHTTRHTLWPSLHSSKTYWVFTQPTPQPQNSHSRSLLSFTATKSSFRKSWLFLHLCRQCCTIEAQMIVRAYPCPKTSLLSSVPSCIFLRVLRLDFWLSLSYLHGSQLLH